MWCKGAPPSPSSHSYLKHHWKYISEGMGFYMISVISGAPVIDKQWCPEVYMCNIFHFIFNTAGWFHTCFACFCIIVSSCVCTGSFEPDAQWSRTVCMGWSLISGDRLYMRSFVWIIAMLSEEVDSEGRICVAILLKYCYKPRRITKFMFWDWPMYCAHAKVQQRQRFGANIEPAMMRILFYDLV